MKNKTNKFRNVFLIISFCLLNTLSYGQTKEETISWLSEKLNNNLISDFQAHKYVSQSNLKVIDITPCGIIISYTTSGPGAFGTHHYQITMPMEGIMIYEGLFYYHAEKIIIEEKAKSGKSFRNTSSNICKIRNGEEDLHQRIETALNHLATFCPKKKETF